MLIFQLALVAPSLCNTPIGSARTVYKQCMHGNFGRGFTKYTVPANPTHQGSEYRTHAHFFATEFTLQGTVAILNLHRRALLILNFTLQGSFAAEFTSQATAAILNLHCRALLLLNLHRRALLLLNLHYRALLLY